MSIVTGYPERNHTYWETVAQTRWGSYLSGIEKKAIYKAHRLLKKPTKALEIGAEGGRWSRLLSDLGWTMTCTDINEKTLAICKERIPTANCILVKANDNTLPCESESLSLVLCIEVPPAIQAKWFPYETFRVLQKDGLIVGVFWNRFSLRGLIAHIKSIFTGSFDYYKFSYLFWKKRVQCGGFTFIHEEGYCWFPFSRTSNSAMVPFFVSLEGFLGLRKLPLISPWVVFVAQKSSQSLNSQN